MHFIFSLQIQNGFYICRVPLLTRTVLTVGASLTITISIASTKCIHVAANELYFIFENASALHERGVQRFFFLFFC